MQVQDIRAKVVERLGVQGYQIRSIARGSGSPAFSRIELRKGGERQSCAVKVTTEEHGRIHFDRDTDGRWKVLQDVDRVLHVWQHPAEPSKISVAMFDAATIQEAFDANHAATTKEGIAHLPPWLSPDRESGRRFVGSGYGDKALWRDVIDTKTAFPPAPAPSPAPVRSEGGIMGRIKMMLSKHMGISPESIEIDVRVKL